MTTVKYPDVEVGLVGEDGNVFFVIGRVAREIRRAKGEDAAKSFREEASAAGSYDEVLQLVLRTVEVT